MKRFWIVSWSNYYPDAGLDNVRSWHDTYAEAKAIVDASFGEDDSVQGYNPYIAISSYTAIVDMIVWEPGSLLSVLKNPQRM